MTTLTDTTSPPSATFLPASDSPAPAISDSWLLAWIISRSGYPAIVALSAQPPAFPTAAILTPARFALHLTQPLPIPTLMRALAQLRGKRSPRAILLIAEAAPPAALPYREHLQLNADLHVLSIRRNFRKRRHARPRPALLGIAWKLDPEKNPLQSPIPGHPWRTVRALLRQSKFGIVRQEVPRDDAPPVAPHDFRAQLLNQLTPASLNALAEDLRFRPVADFCFAHPSATIDPQSVLRGPLFIDPNTAITAYHIHVGPDWITPSSPAVTWPSQENLPAPHLRNAYFDGPRTGRRPTYDFFKRLFDIAFALFALTITLPICLAVALIIKLYDRGPIFFAHTRETLHGKPFPCLKFRTMVKNAESLKKELRQQNQVDGPQFKIVKDPRVTPIGRFLRKTNIDELPQFLNVLTGDMSVVGPRPSPFEENQLCPAWREARLSVKPGITGLWQISRSPDRGAADFQEWILYDTQYVDRRSLSLDLRILLLTIKELFGQGH